MGTCRRYLFIAGKLDTKSIELLSRWELLHQRRTLVDTFSVLRACATAAPCAEELFTLLQTLYWEQACGLRKSVQTRHKSHVSDMTNLFRGRLLRGVLYK